MQLSAQELDQIRRFFSTRPVLNAYLFGSYARGEADQRSDVDLLVDLDYAGLDAMDFLSWPHHLAKSLGKKVDVVSSNGLHHLYQPFIEADKRLIYERPD